jgi:hypothetical protein
LSAAPPPVSRPSAPQDDGEPFDLQAAVKGVDLRAIKQAAAGIVRCGAALHDTLGREPELREARERAVAGQLDTAEVERGVMEAVAQVGGVGWGWGGGGLGGRGCRKGG